MVKKIKLYVKKHENREGRVKKTVLMAYGLLIFSYTCASAVFIDCKMFLPMLKLNTLPLEAHSYLVKLQNFKSM